MAISRNKAMFVETLRFTNKNKNKNKRGAFSLTLTLGQKLNVWSFHTFSVNSNLTKDER
jgi:hypothetical protein